jgi:hypothetical protein
LTDVAGSSGAVLATFAYVGGDPVNFSDPLGKCMITIWGRFPHNKDWTEVEELDRWATASDCGPPPAFGGDGPGNGGDSGGNGEPGETPADTGDIVITATPTVFRASVEIKYIDGLALWMHFLNGGGETLCLSRSQFGEIVRNAHRTGKPNVGKHYTASSVSMYGTYLDKVYGGGTMIYDNKTGQAVGYMDRYDFDAANRSWRAEIATGIGAFGYLMGGTDFAFGYPCE